MKKTKILAIILIMITLFIGLATIVFGQDNRTKLEISDDQDAVNLGYSHMAWTYNNIYCIEHNQAMNDVKSYAINTKVEIVGQEAKFYVKNKETKTYELANTVEHEANNILGAILTSGEFDGKVSKRNNGGKYTYGYGGVNNYTDAQLGLYTYITTWIGAVGASEYGFEATGWTTNVGQAVCDQAIQKAKEYSYKVTIHLLKCGNQSYQTLIATDPHEPIKTNLPVMKIWHDDENKYNTRPEEIVVKLLANGIDTENTITLNGNNEWKGAFENLDKKDENGQEIRYAVEEIAVPGYETKISPVEINGVAGFEIINTLKRNLEVKKEWNDEDNLDDLRAASITVTLCANGVPTEKSVILSQEEGWTKSFTDLYICDANGEVIDYTVQEEVLNGYTPEYEKNVDENGNVTYIITNTHKPNYEGYIEINGKVWKDRPDGKGNDINGTLEDDESGIEGIKVTLRDKDGNMFDATSTTNTDSEGNYTIRVNYDNSQNVYKLYEDVATVNEKLKTAYVEFEYDAMKYTTVATASTGENTSKAIENETTRNNFDSAYTTVTSSTLHPDNWTDNSITAITKDVISFETYADKTTTSREEVLKYCNGDGTYKRTNSTHAWYDIQTGQHSCPDCQGTGHTLRVYDIDVEVINNVNLGLFEREQPKVGIFSDLSKVEVTMQGQKYTYLYNVRSNENNYVGLQVKFQNKATYTYRRPVNPADIAYLNDGHEDAMTVLVTYEVTIGNLSTTLPITVHNITNYFDSRYTLITEGWTTTTGTEFNQATYNGDLNITVEPGNPGESEPIELTYAVSLEAIKALLKEDATLNNAVEIQSYSTQYGANTLYAEQRTGGRTNLAYAGYDYESHPGNADIFINGGGHLEATKLELDTDIAPSFVLCKDEEQKVLSGTVWEDTDSDSGDNFRLGNGKNENEKGVENVKVELLKVKADGTTEPAYLYYRDETKGKIPAVTYTNNDGYYTFGNNDEDFLNRYGVVTDTYVIKFTYGENDDKNARNYKSTIISSDTDLYSVFKGTMNTDEWHLNLNKGYSIAVDDMQQRIQIEALQYSNFNEKLNMTAQSKPFALQLEFDPSTGKTSAVSSDGKVVFGNELNIFDFGIIERAREDIFVENTIEHVKVTLANGQVLIDGNPNADKLNYAKAIGFGQTIDTGIKARNALDKQIRMEIDAELIQGAQLDIKYAIKVTNNSEKDYDYYVDGQIKTEYYYFGTNNEGTPEITSSVDYLVNYLDPEPTYTWENASDWQQVTADDLRNQGYISEATYNAISNKQYLIYTTTKVSELKPGDTMTDYVMARKLLANQEENMYDNHCELLEIDAKTARTIKETGVVKEYKMGNYVPSLEARRINTDINQEVAGFHEQDDDRVMVSITPPTGTTNYITTYIIAGLFGLIVMSIGVIFIKKKVLTK